MTDENGNEVGRAEVQPDGSFVVEIPDVDDGDYNYDVNLTDPSGEKGD
ncbi:TPA: hypothetical protein JAN03_24750, partial [Citrobacter freundii]|nr:hypothetical protein [Citrobacter freundii]